MLHKSIKIFFTFIQPGRDFFHENLMVPFRKSDLEAPIIFPSTVLNDIPRLLFICTIKDSLICLKGTDGAKIIDVLSKGF